MRHRKKIAKLGRSSDHRKSLVVNLTISLLLNEYIATTEAKAKACKAFTEKIINLAKSFDRNSHRLKQLLPDKLVLEKLANILSKRYTNRCGGFITIAKLPPRKGDNAQMAKLVLIGSEAVRKIKKVKVKKTARKVKKEKGGVLSKVKEFQKRISLQGKKGREPILGKRVETKSRSGI